VPEVILPRVTAAMLIQQLTKLVQSLKQNITKNLTADPISQGLLN
jgi:hypothetical protein